VIGFCEDGNAPKAGVHQHRVPEGFNLVWKPGRKRRFVFEIDNGKVFGIKSGVMPYVKWQECA
jgi:hypothetical protein